MDEKASLSIRKPNKEDFSDSDTVIYTGGISCKAVLENRPQDCRILYVNQINAVRTLRISFRWLKEIMYR